MPAFRGYGRLALRAAGALGAAALSPLAHAKVGNVEFGVCADAAHFDAAVQHGFDYYEMEVVEMDRMDEARFAAFKAQVLASPIRCRAYRSLLRRFQVVGDTAAAQIAIKEGHATIKSGQSHWSYTFKEYIEKRLPGKIKIDVNHSYPLREAAQAHRDVEARKKAIDDLIAPLHRTIEQIDREMKDAEHRRVASGAALHERLEIGRAHV